MRLFHAHTRLCRKEEVLTQQTTWCLRSSGCFYRRFASSSNFTRPLNGEVNETQNKHNLHLIIQRLDKTQDRRISRQEFTSLSVRSTIEKVIHTYELFLLDCSNMLVRCAVQFTFFKKEVSNFCCQLCDTLYGLKRLLLRIHNLQHLFQLYCIQWVGPILDWNAEFDGIVGDEGDQVGLKSQNKFIKAHNTFFKVLFSQFVDWALERNLDMEMEDDI